MSCQKEKFNFIDGVDEKGEPARDCRRGCSHTLQEVPFFSLGTVESEIRARDRAEQGLRMCRDGRGLD